MNLSDFEALSFDCYGTLIDWETGITAVLQPWARQHGVDVDDEALLTAYGDREARLEAEHPDWLYPEILAAGMIALGELLDVPVSADQAQRLAVSVADWPAFPDSPGALASLGEQFKLIILSNVDRVSFAASNDRLAVTFDLILTAQDIGSYKPSPRNFDALLAATAQIGVADGKLLHVAQSLFHDHVPAKNAGLPTIWINRRHDRPGWGATPQPSVGVIPDREFPSMTAFAAACSSEHSATAP